jgi:hypothetical protein
MVFAVTSEGNEPHGQARRSETRHRLPSLGIAPLHNLKQTAVADKFVSQLPLILTTAPGRLRAADKTALQRRDACTTTPGRRAPLVGRTSRLVPGNSGLLEASEPAGRRTIK